jgi:hypothetical protein
MPDVYYVTSFRHLTFTKPIVDAFLLMPGMCITTNDAIRRRLLTDEFHRAAGAIEANYLCTAPNVVFGEFESDDMRGLPPDQFLLAVILWIDGLFRNCWFLHDHCLECDAVFLKASIDRTRSSWTRNYLARRPSCADGSVERSLSMSRADLEAWTAKHDAVESYRHSADSPSIRFMMERGYSRTGSAVEFVSAASESGNLAVKIANYCSAMEALFTTDGAELAHKLAERAALFLGERGEDRRAIYATVKRAYTVRSKTVHGDTLTPKQVEDLPVLSSSCDTLLRTVLNTILEDETLRTQVFDVQTPDPLEQFFQDLVLGDR